MTSGIYAQITQIRGFVKDSFSSEPLPFVNVVVLKSGVQKGGASTDIEGNYLIKPIESGIYDVSVSYIGYKTKHVKNVKVDTTKITILNIFLVPSSSMIKETVITTYSKPLISRDEGSSGRLSKSEIRKAPTRSISSCYDYSSRSSGVTSDGRSLEGPKERMSRDMPTETKAEYSVEKGSSVKSSETDPDVLSKSDQNMAGILTAGQLNDFSKWELWEDISQGVLKTWQNYWKIKPFERFTVQVLTANGRPLPDCEVSLLNKEKKNEWTSKTDNTGKAELWSSIFADNGSDKAYSININYANKNYKITKILKFADGINIITLPVECPILKKADIMFVVDATGSMNDEIQYLKSELNNIILEIKKQNTGLELNLGSVFYRDIGDEYITRKSDFSTDINSTINFIKQQNAAGGGDQPEAVHSALDIAINSMKWSDSAVARLLFLVLDAPPHYTPVVIDSVQLLIAEAAAKGIRIIPITGSGIEKKAEYLMRAFALATNGSYVFLTDHSKVGYSHIKPTTDEYDVELLKDVLLRLLHEYLFVPSCNDKLDLASQQIKDTMYVVNPKIIAHEISDSSLVGKYAGQTARLDTNKVSFAHQTQTIDVTNLKKDSSTISINLEVPTFSNFRFYPNPTTGNLTIEIKGKIEELYLADLSGKLLERYSVKSSERLEINISKYPVGVYFLQYFFNDKWLTGKVVLMR